MKLRNKKTGQIASVRSAIGDNETPQSIILVYNEYSGGAGMRSYTSLAELNEEWEDYEEPKEFWAIENGHGQIARHEDDGTSWKDYKELGNYFETREEAEKAVEKLKAWKKLKDAGFKPSASWNFRQVHGQQMMYGDIRYETKDYIGAIIDFELLFGKREC